MVNPISPITTVPPVLNAFRKKQMEEQQWKMVRSAAVHDPILKDLLDRAVIYWKLKYDNDYNISEN